MNKQNERITVYIGTEHKWMTGLTVKVGQVLLNEDGRPSGLVEVFPWDDKQHRYSWVGSDAREEDLDDYLLENKERTLTYLRELMDYLDAEGPDGPQTAYQIGACEKLIEYLDKRAFRFDPAMEAK